MAYSDDLFSRARWESGAKKAKLLAAAREARREEYEMMEAAEAKMAEDRAAAASEAGWHAENRSKSYD